MSFETEITVAFGDTDPAGLVYFPNILHYCHIAMERFFLECCGFSYSSLIRDQNVGFPTVKSESEFLIPILYGDTISVQVQVLELGKSSVQFQYSIRRLSDPAECARIRQVHVAMNLSTRRSTPISTEIRHCIEAHL